MKRVPITSIISKWLAADEDLKNKCEFEQCKYDSDSAYRGYVIGFQDGVNSQLDDQINKAEIVEEYRRILNAGDFTQLVSEEDCLSLISTSSEYNFLAGAMWMFNKIMN